MSVHRLFSKEKIDLMRNEKIFKIVSEYNQTINSFQQQIILERLKQTHPKLQHQLLSKKKKKLFLLKKNVTKYSYICNKQIIITVKDEHTHCLPKYITIFISIHQIGEGSVWNSKIKVS